MAHIRDFFKKLSERFPTEVTPKPEPLSLNKCPKCGAGIEYLPTAIPTQPIGSWLCPKCRELWPGGSSGPDFAPSPVKRIDSDQLPQTYVPSFQQPVGPTGVTGGSLVPTGGTAIIGGFYNPNGEFHASVWANSSGEIKMDVDDRGIPFVEPPPPKLGPTQDEIDDIHRRIIEREANVEREL